MAKRQMSKREKVILGLTVTVCVGALLWLGYLERFIADYQNVGKSLIVAKKKFQMQRKILEKGQVVERAYGEIEGSLPPLSGDLRPEMQFTQELARLFNQLKLRPPSISPAEHREVPGAEDFVYIVLPVMDVDVNLEEMSRLLKGIYERNLVVQELRIQSTTRRGSDSLRLDIDIARLVQTKDLAPEDQARVVKRR